LLYVKFLGYVDLGVVIFMKIYD